MRLLLDTHIFLWYITADRRLPVRIADAVRDPENDVLLSVVSMWEVIIKNQAGKLPLPAPAFEYLQQRREQHRIASLILDEASLSKLAELPMHHNDPFDRILVSQAIYHGLVIASVDERISIYPAQIFAG